MADKLKRFCIYRGQLKAVVTRIERFINDAVNIISANEEILQSHKEKMFTTHKQYQQMQLHILSLGENDTEFRFSFCWADIDLGEEEGMGWKNLKTKNTSQRYCKLAITK